MVNPDELYQKLISCTQKVQDGNGNVNELLFLTGAVHALRLVNGYKVPEIELPFILINQTTKEDARLWV